MKKSDYSPGTVLANRYKIVDIIGRGGVGIIVSAVDLILNLDVAVKILALDHTGTSAARLQREATSAGKLSHPGIARIMDFGQTEDGAPYMVMELLQGINLSQFIQERGKINFHTAMPIFYQICDAIDFAHKNNIVHRDLKPSNVMLLEQPSGGYLVKLLDFGVAKTQLAGQTLTPTGIIIGSPFYISPEQVQGEDVDVRSDIYSMGCLMYETLSGKPPFVGNTPFETASMHMKSPPPVLPDGEGDEKIPNSLIDIIGQCLQKEKDKRPASMRAIMDQLRPLLVEEIDHAEFQNRKTTGSSKINPTRIMALVGIVITLIGTWIYIQSPQKKRNVQKPISNSRNSQVTTWDTYKELRDDYKNKKFEQGYLGKLKSVTNLSDIVKDDDFSSLKDKRFDYMRLRPCDVTGTGFSYLKNSGLQIIKINDSKITDEGVKEIAKIKSINNVFLQSSKITERGVAYLKDLPALHSLYLYMPTFSDRAAEELAKIKTLTNLEIFSPQFNDSHLDYIVKMPNLEYVSLKGTDIGADAGVKLSRLPKLNAVIFSGMKSISLESLEALRPKKLRYLKFKDLKLSQEQLVVISKMKSLRWLDFGRVNLSAEQLKLFLNLPYLEHLELDGPRQISEEFMDVLGKFQLENINLEQTSLTDKQLLKLQNMKTLRTINLSGCDDLSNEAIADFVTRFKYRWKADISVINNETRDMAEFL